MAIDALLAGIGEEAEQEREAILEGARAEAERIVGEAERGARARAEASTRVLEEELRTAARERHREARLEALAEVSAARERMIERIMADARRRLIEAQRGAQGDRVLAALLSEGLRYAGPGEVELRCAPADVDRVRRSMPAGLEDRALVVPDAEVSEGLLIVALQGRLEVHASLGDRLESARAELAGPIVVEVERERAP